MTWWLATHRAAPTVLLLMLASSVALTAARADLAFPVLSGSAPFAPVPLVAVLSAACVIVVATSLDVGEEAFLSSAQRNVRALEAVHVVAAFGAIGFTCCAALLVGVAVEDAWLMVRDSAAFLSLLVLARALSLGKYSAALPVGCLLVASTFGRTVEGLPAFWAWPLLRGSEADTPALLLSAIAVAVLVAEAVSRRRLVRLRGSAA